MIQPLEHETPFPWTRGSLEEILDPGARLQTSVSLLAHVVLTVEKRQRWRAGHHLALALTGNLHLPELHAEIAFCPHDGPGHKNGHAHEHWATASIIPRHHTMTIPLQHLSLPTREDSDVWALTPGPDHDLHWVEHYAGRLEGEPLTFDQYVPVDVTWDIMFTPEECHVGRGSRVNVAGELRFERPVRMPLLFRDPEQSTGPSTEPDNGAVLIAAGSRVPIPRQAVSRVAGRGPGMTVRLIKTEGRIVCVEQFLAEPVRRAS